MKLIKKETKAVARGVASITVSQKGMITISKKAAVELKLQVGDEIEFHQDADAPSDWYIKQGPGLKLRQTPGGLMTNSVSICHDISNCIAGGEIKKSIRLNLSTEPIEGGFYAIITRRAI